MTESGPPPDAVPPPLVPPPPPPPPPPPGARAPPRTESGKRIVAKQISDDEARRMGMTDEFIEMYKFFRDFGYYGGEEIGPLARQLNPNMKDFRSFLRTNKEWRDALSS